VSDNIYVVVSCDFVYKMIDSVWYDQKDADTRALFMNQKNEADYSVEFHFIGLGNVIQIFSANDYFEFCDEIAINDQICSCGGKLFIENQLFDEFYFLKNYGLKCSVCGGRYPAMEHNPETSIKMREIFKELNYDKVKINEYFTKESESTTEDNTTIVNNTNDKQL